MIPQIQGKPIAPADRPLFQAAQKLEATFLAEMLKATRTQDPEADFTGGAGEDQFQSFLLQAQADKMVGAGGIGLAENLFKSLLAHR